MSVNHKIVIGYGVRVPKEVLRGYQNAIDPDDEFFISELLDDLLKDFPLIRYIEAGSYYDSGPMEHALIMASTSVSASDLAGFLDLKHAVITSEERQQLTHAWFELCDRELTAPQPSWQIGGLWS